jgi:hypothetical protein
VLLLLTRKEVKNALLFSVTAAAFTLLYFFDLHSTQELQSMLHQFTTDSNVATKAPLYMGLLKEQQRFFHSPIEIIFSLLLIFSLTFNFQYLKKNFGNQLLYLLFLIVGLALFSHGKTAKYGIHYFPYIATLIVAGYLNIFQQRRNKALKITGIVLLAGFVAVHSVRNFTTITRKIDLAAHNAALSALIPEKDVKIMSTQVFIFNEITHYTTIRSDIAYIIHRGSFTPNEEETIENYLRFAGKHGDKYVRLDKSTSGWNLFDKAAKLGLNPNDAIACGGYKLIHKSNTYFIFERIGD